MDYTILVTRFIESIEAKNLDGVMALLADDIKARDGLEIIEGRGKFAAIQNEAFLQARKIKVTVVDMFQHTDKVYAEVLVEVNLIRTYLLHVFEFEGDKISSIKTFRG